MGACSSPIAFEVVNDLGSKGVSATTPVSISATPSGGLSLFAGPGCTAATPVTLAPAASSGSFSFRAVGDAGTYSLTLSALGLSSASQQATVVSPSPSGLAFTTAVQTVRAGDCSAPVTVELRDGTNAPATVSIATAVALTSTPAIPGVLFFFDAQCTQPIAQAIVPAGASTTTFYVSRATGLSYSLSATLGFATGSLPHHILPVVRAGSCLLASGNTIVTCPVEPPVLTLSDSFLVYQVASGSAVSGSVATLCELTGAASVTCRRGLTDMDALINWQVAEVKGATVQKAQTNCDGGSNIAIPIATSAPIGSSFVLSAGHNIGNAVDDNDFNIARLNGAGTGLEFLFGGICASNQGMLGQVVTMPNITVTRGTTTLAEGIAQRTIVESPAPQSGVLLAQWLAPSVGPAICDRTIRPELNGALVSFSRGNGSVAPFCAMQVLSQVFYEKIDFKTAASVQQISVMMGANIGATMATITAVDRTRTLVFTGGQASMGQSLGESAHEGTTNTTDFQGEVAVLLSLGGTGFESTQLVALRASMLGASRWSAYVVELAP